ncbi:hypothetical protein [Nocardia seriolae]|uniref:hypothetical protein n=1 Tax=Nocardia seriolae TaxID=37332 RepID=UPI001D1679AE|nr:hypothetical protein [Nocardia seriolae]WNJ57719.1 hypothetical protein RMO66_30655 [Nocardia seriolae]
MGGSAGVEAGGFEGLGEGRFGRGGGGVDLLGLLDGEPDRLLELDRADADLGIGDIGGGLDGGGGTFGQGGGGAE